MIISPVLGIKVIRAVQWIRAKSHQGCIGVGPAEVQGAVREGLHAVVEGHQAGQGSGERSIVVNGHLVECCAAPPARVLKPAAQQALSMTLC